MKNFIKFLYVATIMMSLIIGLTACGTDLKEVDTVKEGNRYINLVNETNQVINNITIQLETGETVFTKENPDEANIILQIPKKRSDVSTYIVTFIDRYDLKYEKIATNVASSGVTKITITEKDYVEQKGDLEKKINQFMNGD